MKKNIIFDKYVNVHNQMIDSHGFTEKSLWGSKASQQIRFKKFLELFQAKDSFSVLDIGCGLCDFHKYLLDNGFNNFKYTGLEINPKFVKIVKESSPEIDIIEGSIDALNQNQEWDYVVASGIFNLGESVEDTTNFFINQFKIIYPNINKGFAVNFLSKYSENQDNTSIYHDPINILQNCLVEFSKYVRLDQNYLPHDFTVFVYKYNLEML